MGLFSLFVIVVQQSTKASTHASMYITHVLSTDVVLCRFVYCYYYLAVSTRGPYSTVQPAKI